MITLNCFILTSALKTNSPQKEKEIHAYIGKQTSHHALWYQVQGTAKVLVELTGSYGLCLVCTKRMAFLLPISDCEYTTVTKGTQTQLTLIAPVL